MNDKIRFALAMGFLGLTAGCGALPHSAAVRTETASTLVFEKGPENAVVVIDGQEAGHLAGNRTIIAIPNGTHDVVVRTAIGIVFQKTVFIEDGTRKIIPLSN